MEKTYQPSQIEAKWSHFWESQKYGKPTGSGPSYSIMIPPPNVTGSLHMGHGFQYTLMDILIRHHKLRGYNTLWQVGTDHAGIATQMLVERNLALKDIHKHDIGREAFLDHVWHWKNQSGSTITSQMRRMGILVDWDRERFTMDEGLTKSVNKVFCELYKEGLIYRAQRLVNWDTSLKTAVSDLEIVSQPTKGKLYYITYNVVDSDQSLTVATTRPETLFGDEAIAVHPEDPRFKDLIGKQAFIPVSQKVIPIIADDHVEMSFGTGCLKITPGHDFNDHEIGKKHHLPMTNIMNEDGTLNHNVPKHYQNLSAILARKQLVEELETQGSLNKIEDHDMIIPYGDRSGTVIEPRLTLQWFIDMKDMAKLALQSGENGDFQFYPANWINTYNQWLENINDWCISRQIWWGHRIPAWFDSKGNVFVGLDESSVRKEHQIDDSTALHQDDDVLDTWFSSALWPFSTLNWPEDNVDLQNFYPSSVMVTGFDIIFFWVARMIMMGQKFMGTVPFKDIYLTGLIRDFKGDKMSKSKGNVINPIDVIDGIDLESLLKSRTDHLMQPELKNKIVQLTKKEFPQGISGYGTDALRFTFCALASTGRDVKFDMARLEGYRNFCNKIWNATRFILMLEEKVQAKNHGIQIPATRWLANKITLLKQEVEQHIEIYRFDLCAQALHHGFWHDFCDWYIEISKTLFEQSDEKVQSQIIYDLKHHLSQYLFLLHPIIPFITEEISTHIQSSHDSILDAPYPENNHHESPEDISAINTLIQWTSHIRTIRSELGIKPNAILAVHGLNQTPFAHLALLKQLTKITDHPKEIDHQQFLMTHLGEHALKIDLNHQINLEKELIRLQKQLEKYQKEYASLKQKLTNPKFSENAPSQLIQQSHSRIEELGHLIKKNTHYIDILS
ncbi:valine--tRNA ligase [Gammaproteobacteria bacterium]|nr:valine--tRNA ligase [Gammaproteobacteria bacterium]